MKYKIKVYSIWEFGQRKDAQGNPHQEDSVFPAFGRQKDSDRLFILCDGMGGHDAGEVASSTVCEAMSKTILSHGAEANSAFSDAMLQEAIDAAFDELDKKDTGAVKKMGTTMTFLKLHDKGATIAHMGDSRVYQIRQGETKNDTKIIFETEDHSLVNDMIKIGELTPEEAKHSKQKNIITRAMQPHMERQPKADIKHTVDIKPGDYFYLCSDGMLENMEDEFIPYYFSRQIATDEERVEALTKATAENKDNHSAIIVHILEVEDPIEIPQEEETEDLGPLAGKVSDSPESEGEMVDLDKNSAGDEGQPRTTAPVGGAGSTNDPLAPKPNKRNNIFTIALAAMALIVVAVLAIPQFKPAAKPSADEPEKETTQEPIQAPGPKGAKGTGPSTVRREQNNGNTTPAQQPPSPNNNGNPTEQPSTTTSGTPAPTATVNQGTDQNAPGANNHHGQGAHEASGKVGKVATEAFHKTEGNGVTISNEDKVQNQTPGNTSTPSGN